MGCNECDDRGYTIISCCGDDMVGNDVGICPTCKEHCSQKKEICIECSE